MSIKLNNWREWKQCSSKRTTAASLEHTHTDTHRHTQTHTHKNTHLLTSYHFCVLSISIQRIQKHTDLIKIETLDAEQTNTSHAQEHACISPWAHCVRTVTNTQIKIYTIITRQFVPPHRKTHTHTFPCTKSPIVLTHTWACQLTEGQIFPPAALPLSLFLSLSLSLSFSLSSRKQTNRAGSAYFSKNEYIQINTYKHPTQVKHTHTNTHALARMLWCDVTRLAWSTVENW